MLINVKKLIVASSISVYGGSSYDCENCGMIYPQPRDRKQFEKREWEVRCPICGKIVEPVPIKEERLLYLASIYGITKRT